MILKFKNNQKARFIVLPVLLIISTSTVFYFASSAFGRYSGYLIGFVFYWLFWCLFIPKIVAKRKIRDYFKNEHKLFVLKNWWIILLLLSTMIAPIFMYFIPNLRTTDIAIVLLGVPFAIIHAFFEELFWRGLYIKTFPNSVVWGIIVPTVFFTLWHIAPQLSIRSEHPLIFVLSTIPLGLTYALTAYVTKSAKCSIIGHAASGFFAYSGLLAISFYRLMM